MSTTTAGAIRRPALARAPRRLLGDERLGRLVLDGDNDAFATLYARHHQAIFRYALAIVRREEDAHDVLQSTMANALAALGRGLPDAPVRPWLFRIAHNEAISVLRRRRPAAELDEATLVAAHGLEATVEDRRRLALLVADLQDLPERQRGALVMRELSGLSHVEIGAALGVPAAKAKQAILDARLSLREFDSGRAMRCAEVQRVISAEDGRQLRGRPVRAHLRDCVGCRDLRDAIRARRSDFALLAPPLPPALAAGLLAKLFGGGGSGGGGAVMGKVAGGTLMGKALTGAVLVATVGGGVGMTALRAPARGDRASAPRAPAAPAPRPRPDAALAPASASSTEINRPGARADRSRGQPSLPRLRGSARRQVPSERTGAPAGSPRAAGEARGRPSSSPGLAHGKPFKPAPRAKAPRAVPAPRPVTPSRPKRTPPRSAGRRGTAPADHPTPGPKTHRPK